VRYRLECLKCGESCESDYESQTCGKCGGLLEVVYEGRTPRPEGSGRFWDYEPFLPVCDYAHYEVGSTKLIKSRESSGVFLKLEIDNPTRSFKDRGSVVEISKAVEYGYKEVSVASTGNMAYSIAYYAKLAGLRVKAFISIGANRDKVKDIRGMGDADIDFVNGDFTKAQGLAVRYAKKAKAFLAGDYCYRKEGQKTMAYEIIDQMPDVTQIVVPVGNATLISGVFKALKEMKAAGRIKRMPMLVGVQSKGSDPLVNAFKSSKGLKHLVPNTAADAIAVGFPTFGAQALDALRETKGKAMAVSDGEMEKEQRRFYEQYGLIAELAGVASLAALKKIGRGSGGSTAAIISGGNV
jgi:threonine synthase